MESHPAMEKPHCPDSGQVTRRYRSLVRGVASNGNKKIGISSDRRMDSTVTAIVVAGSKRILHNNVV